MANLFCGYACVVYAMRGEYQTAAPFIGFAIVLDMLDGRIARLTGTSTDFGLQFDSLADVISFGIAPAILSFAWGWRRSAGSAGRPASSSWRRRDATRAVQYPDAGGGDKRYFVGMPSPAAAAIPASTVFFYPAGVSDYRAALPALAMVLVPAVLMVSTIRFRSFKTIDLQIRRPYTVLLLIAGAIMLITTHPRFVLVACHTRTSRRPSSGWRSRDSAIVAGARHPSRASRPRRPRATASGSDFSDTRSL